MTPIGVFFTAIFPLEVNEQALCQQPQLGQNFEGKSSRAHIAENSPDSSSQIQRYIRLNELEPELLQLVDEGKIGMTPAVEISYLKPDEQRLLIETIDSEQATPSFSQAQRISPI